MRASPLNADNERGLRALQKRLPLIPLLEILSVYEGIKPCARLGVQGADLMDLLEWVRALGLAVRRADFKVVAQPDAGKGRLANRSRRVSLESPAGIFYVYVAPCDRRVRLARGAEGCDALLFGETLGYPECCIRFFSAHLEEQARRQMDFIIPSIHSTAPAPLYSNHALRGFGCSLISHFPCSPHCAATLALGAQVWECLQAYFPEAVAPWKRTLGSLVVYTEYSGIFYLPGYERKGDAVHYREVRGSVEGGLLRPLRRHRRLTLHGEHAFSVGRKRFEDKDMVLISYV